MIIDSLLVDDTGESSLLALGSGKVIDHSLHLRDIRSGKSDRSFPAHLTETLSCGSFTLSNPGNLNYSRCARPS
jgi:hypothetical protein